MKKISDLILAFLFLLFLFVSSHGIELRPAAGSTEVVDSVRNLVFFEREAVVKDGFYAIVAGRPRAEADTFYMRQIRGFEEAVENYGYTPQVVFPEKADSDSQVIITEDLLEKGIDGICIDPVDEEDLTEALEKAEILGISIVFMDYEATGDWGQTYVSPISVNQEVYNLLEAVCSVTGGTGSFALVGDGMGNNQSELKSAINAFIEARSKYGGLELRGSFGTDQEGQTVEEVVDTLLKNNPDLDAIWATSPAVTKEIAQVLTEQGNGTRLVGLGRPGEMADFVGSGNLYSCSSFLSWRSKEYGSLCGYYLMALAQGTTQGEDLLMSPMGDYPIKRDENGTAYISLDGPFIYNENNIEKWKITY